MRIRAYLYDCIVVNEPKLLPSTAEKYLQNLTAVFGGLDANEDATKQTAAQFYKHTLQEPNQRMIITGYQKAHSARKPAWMSKKIPIKAEWIDGLQRIGVQKVQHSLRGLKLAHPVGYELAGRRVQLAIAIGFYFLCRKSEYLPGINPHVSWCVAWEDVSFYDASGKILEWFDVAKDRVHVESVSLHIQYSKTDAKGVGRTPSMKRMEKAGHYCVVNELVSYFKLGVAANYITKEKQHMMSLKEGAGQIKDLSPHLYDSIFEAFASATLHGMERGRIVPHGLRVGGATALALAGLSVMHICNQGGWSIESASSLRRYAQASIHASETITSAFMYCLDTEESEIWE